MAATTRKPRKPQPKPFRAVAVAPSGAEFELGEFTTAGAALNAMAARAFFAKPGVRFLVRDEQGNDLQELSR